METTATPSETPRELNDADALDGTPDATAKRKRQPRNSACQSCAGLKMKCIASSVAGCCERCHRMSRECLPSIPKPRKRQSINGLGEHEIRGAPLSQILDNTATPLQTTSSRSPPIPVHPGPDRYRGSPRDASGALSDVPQNVRRSFASFFVQSLGLDEHSQSLLDCLTGLDQMFVQESFAVFEGMAQGSPFINAPRLDAVQMVSTRPVTSLAICTVTTAANTDLRHRLVRVFRQTISTKCIIESDSSVDLMCGLFIHTMWHHRYMHKQQIYRYLNLLAGMTAELGLYQQTRSYGSAISSEALLLFLGCHYLCTIIAGIASDRPSPIRWSISLANVADDISGNGFWMGKRDGPGIVELGRRLEDADTAIRRANEALEAQSRVWSTWHNAEAELRQLKESFRWHGKYNLHPDMSASKIIVSSIVLQSSGRLQTANVQTKLITEMAIGIKDYFDELFVGPPAAIFSFSIIDWTHLLSVLAVLVLMLHPHYEAWEAVPGAIRSLLEPEALLDTIVARMGATPAHERHDELLGWFSHLVAKIKAKWRRDKSAMRPRTGSGDVSETEARFRPVNAGVFCGDRFGPGEGQQTPRRRSGFGVCDVDVGRVCKLDLLEDAFWDRLLQS